MTKSGTATEPARVRQMFGGIARRYDLANHTLSCGIDFYWRKRAANTVASWRPCKILDLATGTGDLALALQKKLPDAEVTGVDFLPEMLELAQRKGVRQTILGDAMKLPFPNGSFDCVTIAFGLRNMENWRGALAEMSRVLRRDGHLLVLEFSLPTISIVRTIYRFYLHRCLPMLGSFLTGRKSAYDYLGDSIEEFPSGCAMIDLIEASGFRRATLQPLSFGIVTIYTAQSL
ncbi:MAG: bifunctional demethylmenaquinone methyltransferase/2-methoxy-6-polyprenyl-1,4-benzoquinol methylase UbiE [Verrucomicrobia bacterium]|nr:MAG: bifunctional demethylmenaquinone methyltransferase/2-methoxy-6-polyprenyl-1,4-benzoquinol methylase UbiE [Verrucomicrobiota bacterium]